MPRKRRHLTYARPNPPVAHPAQSPSPGASSDRDAAPAGVNQLLANLRRASIAPSAAYAVPPTAPSLPPSIREVLQLPETPAPLPRRAARPRLDQHGRRLPAGPAPPRSWLSTRSVGAAADGLPWLSRLTPSRPAPTTLPGNSMPAPGSFLDLLLRSLASDWEVHRVYNKYHLYWLPSHLKPALIRHLGVATEQGASVADIRALLLPPADAHGPGGDEPSRNSDIGCLDLCGSVGRSLQISDISRLLFPVKPEAGPEQVKEAWDAGDVSPTPSPPRVLLPNLTHLSLALDPTATQDVSWSQLLALSPKLSAVTHLSLAFWPAPCRKRPGQPFAEAPLSGPESGGDWSEALPMLRLLSRNLYRLEYLDLTGCWAWFEALKTASGHNFVDWVWAWGKVSVLRLYAGWTPGEDAEPSEKTAHVEAVKMARSIERHIISKRAGKAMYITVEYDGEGA